MNPTLINWPAVLVAALSGFMVGGIWYSPKVFGTMWMADSKLNQDDIKTGNKGKIFGFTAFFCLLMSVNLAFFLAPPAPTTLTTGTLWGTLAGVWTFSAIAIHSLFELKSWRLIFINGGYSVVSLALMGLILGAWR